MFFRKPRPAAQQVFLADVHLPVRLGHRDAERLFAAPLDANLRASTLGAVVHTELRKRAKGQVVGVDMTLELRDISKQSLCKVVALCEAMTVPHGSSLRLAGGLGAPILFGQAEGLELSMDLPFAASPDKRNDLTRLCGRAIDDIAVNRGWLQTGDATHFYFYGATFQSMKDRLVEHLAPHPEFCHARLERLA